ncbi:MAG TPA: integrase, partial [Nitrososphaeria archaeon]|nr:integrase [Nitrososphaeria archaeon]
VRLGSLSVEARRAILGVVASKLGDGAPEALGIPGEILDGYLSEGAPPDDLVRRALGLLDEGEFVNAVGSVDALGALGIVDEYGHVDYSIALQALALASRDEYLRRAILNFTAQNFREDLRRMLGIPYATVKLRWTDDFEQFLREGKRRKKVTTEDTLTYYRNLFAKYLEGKELTEELVDYVVRHRSKWLRNVFRHYVQYLYRRRAIGPDLYGWMMDVVPSRSYHMDVRPYQIREEDATKTFDFLRVNHRRYYLVYRMMLEGGVRLEHALRLLETFSPQEIVEVPGISVPIPRLFVKDGFARYYLGLVGSSTKPCMWIYLSSWTLEELRSMAPLRISRRVVTKYARAHDLLLPKMIRKLAWREMVQSMPREVARFVQSRLGELKVSEARYEDLLSEADSAFPGYLRALSRTGIP